ncbi:acyl-CoA dehydrogenase family protein [Georgenia ruanii]|uniref:Dibenzothiophene monooxygenase n=1 Tax=Georgenia ruanii TaxID=348442 RepID=A0A7J9UY65_9MICO|nr:acyl-CoA dehydrogenase family protein [Georgenia ruanii]MPV89578.1 monooxygenase [Georgenia ruanii]
MSTAQDDRTSLDTTAEADVAEVLPGPHRSHRHEAPPTDSELEAVFRPVFERIAATALERELGRVLPFEPVDWLREVRFGALRVPQRFGGHGATWEQLLALLIDLGAADPNVAHLYRGHIAVVEEKLTAPPSSTRDLWLSRFGRGDIVGNASTEPGSTPLLKKQTVLAPAGDGWRLTGRKFYSTGSVFADWIDVSASLEDGEQVNVLVSTDQPGVEMSDDWDGFGQKLTGTGTTVFTDAVVEPHALQRRSERLTYLGAVYQVVLLAAAAGIAQRLSEETAEAVQTRKRVYSHGNADLAREDPQILQVVGEVVSAAHGARALVLSTVPAFARARAEYEQTSRAGTPSLEETYRVELDVYRVQVVLADLVLRASTHLFDALGSSAVRIGSALDRHWRNARTILSHNPLVYRARVVGDHAVNGGIPDLVGAVGVATSTQNKEPAQ